MTSFFVRRVKSEATSCDFILEPDANLYTGESDFNAIFGTPTSLEADLLLLSSSIFAADRATLRGEREDFVRGIELQIPVINIARLLPLKRQIELLLRTLSNDTWRIIFRQASGVEERQAPIKDQNGRTLLFSGGLDSLAAAIEFDGDGEPLQLVSHKTRNRFTDEAQRNLVSMLKDGGIDLPLYQFFVSSRDGKPRNLKHAEENSQRTRSFLFLILGALAARRSGHDKIVYLAENGQMAIHLPLTQGRIGAFSTHTAHPDFLVNMEQFLCQVLNHKFTILNPYVHLTKAEVVQKVIDKFPDTVTVSQSCWRNARLPAGITHCGECVPCFVRRIAIEYFTADQTQYKENPWQADLNRLDPENVGRRNIADLAEFVLRIHHSSPDEIMGEWPELHSENFDANEVIKMYKRFADEALTVLGRYPSLTPLLS